MKAILAGLVLALGLGGATQEAKAVTLDATDIGTSFFVDFNYANTLLAEFEWTLDSITGSVWRFTVDIANLSSNTPNANRITSFGLSATPDVSMSLVNGFSVWSGVSTGPQAGYQLIAGGIEDCVRVGSNCQGGGGGGVSGGGTSSAVLDLTLLSTSSTLTFDAFAVRFQSINVNGLESIAFQGTERLPPVPLPATALLLIGALGGLGLMRRRRAA